jgi:nucleoid DNA-binding protein
MTKKELVATLASNSADIETKAEASRILETLFDTIKETMAKGDFVDISGFGKFIIREQPEKTGFIPGTKTKYTAKAKNVPAFKYSSKIKEAVATGK